MYWHWQNLNEDRRGVVKGSGFWHGRAWFSLTKNLRFHVEWNFASKSCAIQGAVGGEESAKLHIAIPPASIWLSVAYSPLRRFLPSEEMSTGVRIFDWAIWLEWWHDEMGGWTNRGGYFRNAWHNRELCIHIDDLLLGRQRHSLEKFRTKRGLVCMPEGQYEIVVTFERRTWKRPRWFSKSFLGAQIECPKPIPFPGKGENSWDCGEDALHGMSCGATNMAEAVAEVTKSVLRSRERHGGGVLWQPATVNTK